MHERKESEMIRSTRDRIRNQHALAPAVLVLAAGFLGLLLMGAQPAAAEHNAEVCGVQEPGNLEFLIGEKRVNPGIVFIFEGAVKDIVQPSTRHLAEGLTHTHIEARVNWDTENIPPGTPGEGFVPYLNISAKVTNEMDTEKVAFVPLPPHINLVDNFHYAYNMQLPGETSDSYTVTFYVDPAGDVLGKHYDWLTNYGRTVMLKSHFTYTGCDFDAISKQSRR